MSESYDFRTIEPRWQQCWADAHTFRAAQPGEPRAERPKFYVLDFFPYPSGAGLHVGHPLGYIASDIIARFMRMRGFNVLHPMGWDAFGLPAEQYAIETGIHPAITTRRNIATYTRQLQMLGLSYDWSRELATCDPSYYRWTQWVFLQIFNAWYDPQHVWTDPLGRTVRGRARPIAELPVPPEIAARGPAAIEEFRADHRLAYLAEVPVNWCPALGTVLANEEVTADGRSERGNHPVFRRPMKQWMLRITDYADRLLSDLEPLDWPEPIKLMQRNWIGRSEGAYVDFRLAAPDGSPSEHLIRVFTTRPDTLFGATYLVLAPEHHLVPIITTPAQRDAVHAYVEVARQKSDIDRTSDSRTKTGVFTGAHAVNPVNGAQIGIWVADYVLAGYGTGSIMSVPAHDTRDFEFAAAFNLPIRDVIYPRTVAAMKYFCDNALPDEQAGGAWIGRLADFLGALHPEQSPDDDFARALQRVRTRRTDPPPAPPPTADELAQLAGPERVPRGAIRATWMDAIEALGVADFNELREIFRTARYFARRGAAHTGEGVCVNCTSDWGSFDGLPSAEARRSITAKLEADDRGEHTVQYKLRDWLFSRQRYWGEPFPILYDTDGAPIAESADALPVTLPEMDDFKPAAIDDPTVEPATPLSRAAHWTHVQRDGRTLRRELNTMPQWAGSCWYYLRFCDPHNDRAFVGPAAERYWLGSTRRDALASPIHAGAGRDRPLGGVDLYMGGAEHAVLHLLYARFWHKMLFDLGLVSSPEPFQKLFNQGMIGADSYRDERGAYVPADEITDGPPVEMPHPDQLDPRRVDALLREGRSPAEAAALARVRVRTTCYHNGRPVLRTFDKMSKSKRNVVNPDDIVREYGADTLRLYEMSMGPLEASKPWNTRDIIGVHRFLQRVWRLVIATGDPDAPSEHWSLNPRIGDTLDEAVERLLHRTIAKVEADIARFAFNTAIAQMIVFVNEAQHAAQLGRDQVARFLQVLAPFAPHVAEELWSRLGRTGLVSDAPWPSHDPALLKDDTVEIAVQVNGKVRGRVSVPADADDAAMVTAARTVENVQRELGDRPVRKAVCVKGRLVNLIV
ncbi:MAG: leucine--tRNA ligase [Planctomycetia bacterium]|nr:MAG: leucine--tRNA ligase [Planctomycetia bacterium]